MKRFCSMCGEPINPEFHTRVASTGPRRETEEYFFHNMCAGFLPWKEIRDHASYEPKSDKALTRLPRL